MEHIGLHLVETLAINTAFLAGHAGSMFKLGHNKNAHTENKCHT